MRLECQLRWEPEDLNKKQRSQCLSCCSIKDLQYSIGAKTYCPSHTSALPHVVWSLSVCAVIFHNFVFHFQLLSCLFFSFLPVSLPPLSVAVRENREEPWSRFQYLWWHQWPGEPLQTLRHGTSWPGLPANRSLPGFTSELPWKLLLVTAVFSFSVCLSVCGATA